MDAKCLNVVNLSIMNHCFHSAFITPIATQPQMRPDSYLQKLTLHKYFTYLLTYLLT